MNNYKKRILFCTESSHIKSGYGNYTRSVLNRLFDTAKYEIAELSCYRTCNDNKDCRWKIYPNAVDKSDPRFAQYNSNISNGFGQWRFDLTVAHFKPDIVIDFRDVFMTTFERTSVFRNKFHWILAPTIDSLPIRHEWLDLISNCDTLLTHTEWAKNSIEQEYGVEVKGIVRDSLDTNIFKPLNKIACRKELGLGLDSFIIGSVMRNQKRKLIPDLLKVLSQLNIHHSTYLYLHTSYPESIGWDIPDLLLEYGIYDKVLFTYVCKHCNHWLPMKWKGAQSICPKCSHRKMTLSSVSNGIDDNGLAKIYNSMDLYIQYAICEGFGIPPLEAASCGVPFVSVDHGAMAEIADHFGAYKVPVCRVFRDQEQSSDRVYPDNDSCVNIIKQYSKLSLIDRMKLSESYRQTILNQHSWDYTANSFEKIIDNIEILDSSRWSAIPDSHFAGIDKTIQNTNNNRDFVYKIIDQVLEQPELKHSFFAQQLVMALDDGFIITEKNVVPYTQKDVLKTLEVWFNNKVMLNKFLGDNSIIKQNDFLEY